MSMPEVKTAKIHLWEAAGLGVAPFRVVGLAEMPSLSLAEHNPAAYQNAMQSLPRGYGIGSCRCCAAGLKNNYLIESSDGKKFAVGSECVNKAGDGGLVDKMRYIKRQVDRDKRFKEREAACIARHEEERSRNGGLTDDEVAAQRREQEETARLEALAPLLEVLEPIAQRLADGRGGFRDSIAKDLREGKMPEGRGLDIMVEILAKQKGRRRSDAYEDEEERLYDLFDRISAGEFEIRSTPQNTFSGPKG